MNRTYIRVLVAATKDYSDVVVVIVDGVVAVAIRVRTH